MTIAVSAIQLGEDEERLVLEVLRSGRLAQGPMVERFEAQVADMAGTLHAVAMSSGTTALVAALEAVQLSPGDEVLTSPFTFVATLNAILEAGATATFCDIGSDFNMDPERISEAITPRTRVLMPVHLYGQAADMGAITDHASVSGLAVVEDAAQAHGASCGGRPVGSFGIGCFSFYATKNVTTAEGGAVTTDDDAIADRLRLLRGQGMRERYQYEIAGHNYRMTELQAALGIPQMDRLAALTQARRRNAARLTEGLRDLGGLQVPAAFADRTHVYHQYTVMVTEEAGIDRDQLSAGLAARGVGSGVYYPRVVFDYECYRGHPRVVPADVPRATRAASRVLSLPVHPLLSDAEIDSVIDAVRECVGA